MIKHGNGECLLFTASVCEISGQSVVCVCVWREGRGEGKGVRSSAFASRGGACLPPTSSPSTPPYLLRIRCSCRRKSACVSSCVPSPKPKWVPCVGWGMGMGEGRTEGVVSIECGVLVWGRKCRASVVAVHRGQVFHSPVADTRGTLVQEDRGRVG